MGHKRGQTDERENRSDPNRMVSPIGSTGSFRNLSELLKFSFLVILVFLIYSNTLKGPFVFDDLIGIQDNRHIRLTSLTLEGAKKIALLKGPSPQRPVANISFALNYYVHRYNVPGYHLVNILIHVATGLFLYLFVKTTLNLPALRSRYESYQWVPFFAVLIWLVHPIQTQSVTYIVQRMNSMAATFYVLALLLYTKARLTETKRKKRLLFAGCLLSGILALGSKEIAATLPFFIFLYEWYFFQDLSQSWLKRRILPLAGVLFIICLVGLIYLGADPLEKIMRSYKDFDFTLSQRVLTEFRVVIFYLSLLVFPHPSRLNLDHAFPLSHSLIDPITTLLCLGLVVGMVGLAIYTAKKNRLLSFSILWFLGNLVIESSVIGLDLLFEHRLYLPSMLVILLVVLLAQMYVRSKWLKVGMLCALTMMFSFWTHERNSIWHDDLTLWKDCVEKSPKKMRPHYNMGVALDHRARYEAAANHYIEALRIKPKHAKAHYNLGNSLKILGRLDEAISHFTEALRISPQFSDANNNLGNVLQDQGRVEEAIIHYRAALRTRPNDSKAHYNLGNSLKILGRLDEAISHFAEALRIKPDDASAHNNIGVALERKGRIDEAISHYAEALRISPGHANAHSNMGVALKRQGKIDEAIGHFAEALRIKPDRSEVHYMMGNALRKQGRIDKAISHYAEAVRIKPDYVKALRGLGNALLGQERYEEAIDHFAVALRINPDDGGIHNNMGVALRNLGRLKEAVDHFSEALRIMPENASVRMNLERGLRLIDTPVEVSHTITSP